MDNNLPDDQNQTNSSQKDDNQSAVKPTSTFNKERGAGWGSVEQDSSLAEYKETDLPKETEGWLEKLEKGEDIKLPQPITDDQGQVVLDDIQPQVKKVELPLDKQQIDQGLHQKIWNSVRWLAEWCLRAARLKSAKFVYKQVEDNVK